MFSRAMQVPVITTRDINAMEELCPGIKHYHQITPIETAEQAIAAARVRLVPELFEDEIVSDTPHYIQEVKKDNMWVLLFETHVETIGTKKKTTARTESLGGCTKH